MDIKSIIARIVEKKLEKDSDDPCWDGYVQLGTKKKGGKEVPNCVPKESVELDEANSNKNLQKAMAIINARITKQGQSPKYPSYDSAPEDIKTAAKNLAKNMKESVELTEDVHNDLNDAIIEFQKKLLRMARQLDPDITKEVKKIDKDLDELRTGPLFKIRPGR